LFEVLEAVSAVWGSDRVGIRLSPSGTFNDMRDSDPTTLFGYVLRELSRQSIAYVHLIEARADEGPADRAWLYPTSLDHCVLCDRRINQPGVR
jgi:2,4-dienoyl-CoA reductase-like NADH-dependent reductase (Old Yellow Enzyme family)